MVSKFPKDEWFEEEANMNADVACCRTGKRLGSLNIKTAGEMRQNLDR